MSMSELDPDERLEQHSPISPDHGSFGAQARLSSESACYDHEWLEEEEEQDALLQSSQSQRGGILKNWKHGDTQRNKDSTSHLQARPRGLLARGITNGGNPRRRNRRTEVLYKVEEGGSRSTTPSSASSEGSSSAVDREKMDEILAQKSSKKRHRLFYTVLHMIIAALFVTIAYGAYQASLRTKPRLRTDTLLSNGTSLFAPTTVLISLDGFRADYLRRGLSPTLASFIKKGVSPKYMTPSFPSLTFPNHYTLVTGLHPESHGIVANSFWDTRFSEEFMYTKKEHSMQSKWWDQNPLWETAELAGVRTAIHMWPGSEAHIGELEPTYVDKYNGSEALPRKADRIFAFLDKPGLEDEDSIPEEPRPQLIAAYVPNVDSDGHKFGPNSTEVNQTIAGVDEMLGNLFIGLDERNLTHIVNIVIVSDHGMATTDYTRLIQFEDVVNPDLIEHIDGWPHYGLRPKNTADLREIHDRLMKEASRRDGFDVYFKEDMPKRYNFANNDRIAPLWIIARTGWAIVTKEEYNVTEGQKSRQAYDPRGIHGYDNEDPLMRAIFVARGPAFPHKPGSRLEPFQNIEVYNIVCDSLGVVPHPNNGTLHLPLNPIGLHGDETDDDPHHIFLAPSTAVHSSLPSPSDAPVTSITDPMTTKPSPGPESQGIDSNGHPDSENKSAGDKLREYWEWVKGSMKDLAKWANDHVHHHEVPP